MSSHSAVSATQKPFVSAANSEQVSTPVWANNEPNAYSANGKTENVVLPGIKKGATKLHANNVLIKGLAAFRAGVGPKDKHNDKSEKPDSFGQAQAYWGLMLLRAAMEDLEGAGSFAKLIRSKSGIADMIINVNSSAQTNAYYMPNTENLHFGTSDKKWDLATDSDVVVHEGGHYVLDHKAPGLTNIGSVLFGYGRAIHESYGDALSAFIFRDPELAEDFGQVLERASKGKGLRNANNEQKAGSSSIFGIFDDPHTTGLGFAGFSWSLGEYMHKVLTGKTRNQKQDAEKLDATAARQSLALLLTFPLYLGSKYPSREDFVRAHLQAVDSLKAAGKLDPRLDAKALKDAIQKEAVKRGMVAAPIATKPKKSGWFGSMPASLHLPAKTTEQNVREVVLEYSKLTTQGFGARPMGEALSGPNGEKIIRFQLTKAAVINGAIVDAVVEDDYVTAIQQSNGYVETQFGVLGQMLERAERSNFGPTKEVSLTEAKLDAARPVQSAAFADLATFAQKDVGQMILENKGLRAVSNKEATSDPVRAEARFLAADSQRTILEGKTQKEFVWLGGTLRAKLVAGGITYYAPVQKDGTLGAPMMVVTAIRS